MAVRDRADLVSRAIESVLAQTWGSWELIVVDDGSTDGTPEVVARYLGDPRIRLITGPHAGPAAARNRGLDAGRGEIVAYLDSDNAWFHANLERLVAAFDAHPEAESAYAAQLWRDHGLDAAWIRPGVVDPDRMLAEVDGIDLNAFAHRRRAYERLGGFDESLSRLIDWDLILRYVDDRPPVAVPAVGGVYEDGPWRRISNTNGLAYNRHRVRRKRERPVEPAPRVLYALWHYPQLSESYVDAEIAYMRRRGVHVEVWSEVDPASPFPTDVPIHRGPLAAAIRRARPHLLHTHWLTKVDPIREEAGRFGLPITVRGHGFEFQPELAARLDADPLVRAFYVFPHLADACPTPPAKLRRVPACFDSTRYAPAPRKDRRLVVRAGAALPTKDLPLFLRVARRCPGHRFVVALVRCNGFEPFADEIARMNAELGGPAEVLVNVPPGEIDELQARAGLYLHTHGPVPHFGMPMTIAEAMATGGVVLARRCPAFAGYVGDAGFLYGDEDEAVALIRGTADWDEAAWRAAGDRAIERAFARSADSVVLPAILEDWVRIAVEARDAAGARRRSA
jgi:glycosyltransferase involved in cell wall biosynthesis